jgi:hypothetical protein
MDQEFQKSNFYYLKTMNTRFLYEVKEFIYCRERTFACCPSSLVEPTRRGCTECPRPGVFSKIIPGPLEPESLLFDSSIHVVLVWMS